METAADHKRPSLWGQSLSRRAFIVGSVGAAAPAVAPGTAVAQNGDDADAVFTDAAISSTVPALDRDDYTGLFVQIVKVEAEEGINVGVEACEFLGSSEETVAYETRVIDRIEEDRQSTSAILYADQGNEDIHEGKLFVVNSQQACSEEFIALRLEQIGAGRIGDIETEERQTETDDGETNSPIPGFGAGTALLGLGGATLLALRRLVD